MKGSMFLEIFGETPIAKVLDFFIENRPFDYSKEEVVRQCELSKPTIYKLWHVLVKYKIIKPTRRYGKAKLYKLNTENEFVKRLISLDNALIKTATDEFKEKAIA